MNNAAFIACVTGSARRTPDWLQHFLDALTARHQLVPLVESDGLAILGDAGAAHLILRERRGVIWGHLFRRDTFSRIAQVPPAALAELETGEFLDTFWGGYVAIRVRGDGVEILRDPSGTVACYHFERDGVHLVTSRPDLLFEHGLVAPSIDWTVIAQSLAFRDLRPAQTALRGVSELLPGVCLTVQRNAASARCAWTPWRFAARDAQFVDSATSIAELRDVGSAALQSWGECFDRPLIEISGGLDSAIVAAGLSGVADAHCLTFGPAPGEADERPWARAVAAHLGLPLEEMLADAAVVDIELSDAWRQPRPCARALSQAFDRAIQAFARKRGADAFLGGAGGDSMFCLLHSALPVLDRIRAEGFGRAVFETAADIARLSRTNAWAVLLIAVRRSMQPVKVLPTPMVNPFLAEDVRATLPWPAGNPWLRAPDDIAPGKRRHVWSIIAIQNHLEGYGRESFAPFIAPLMSQPIFETCLRIPSWHWCIGGNNRAVAREAFRDALPAAVIDRRSKVAFNTLVHRVIAANLPRLRDMLLGGALARERLIDRKRIERYLSDELSKGVLLPELMALVDVEAWVRHWERQSSARVVD